MLEARNQSNEARLEAARSLAKRAANADSKIGDRSPFVAFVLEGKEPHSVAPAAKDDSGGASDGGMSEEEAERIFMASLETKKAIPHVRAVCDEERWIDRRVEHSRCVRKIFDGV